MSSDDSVAPVVVVGAGLSGLSCAKTLKETYGFDHVVVLEADDVIGGRVRTDRDFASGIEVALGGELLHGDTHVLIDIAKAKGWDLQQAFTWSQGDGGPSDSEAPDGGAGYYWLGAHNKLYRFDELPPELEKLHEDLWSIGDLTDKEIDTALKSGTSLLDFLKARGVRKAHLAMAEAGYANTSAGRLDNLSLGLCSLNERGWSQDGKHDLFLRPSTSVIVDHLAEGLRVITRAVVKRVENLGSKALPGHPNVRVVCEDGFSLDASAVVMALPVPVLRDEDIAFCPPLSPEKMVSLRNIHFPNACKLHLLFSRRMWPADCHGVVCSDSFIPEMWFRSETLPSGEVLHLATCFTMDVRADRLSSLPLSSATAMAVSQIGNMFGTNASLALIKSHRFAWSEQKFVRGGYTGPSLRERPEDRANIARKHGECVFFTGDITAGVHGESPMTMQGTINAGARAAKEVAEFSGLLPSTPRSRL